MAGASRKRSSSRSTTRKSLYLWEFLFGLLEDDECASVIIWIKKRDGIFALKNTEELAKLWGTVKNRPKMDKYKLFRAMRTYYDRGMLKKVKGHKGVYQFISIPYKTEGCDQEVNTSGKTDTPRLVGSPEHSLRDFSAIPLNCSERRADHRERTADVRGTTVDYPKSTENNLEGAVDNREQTEYSFDELSGYRSRAKSSSEYSISSDGSTQSLEDLQAHLQNTDILDETDTYSCIARLKCALDIPS